MARNGPSSRVKPTRSRSSGRARPVNRPLAAPPAVCGLRSTPGEVRGAAMRAQHPAVACRVLLGLVFAALLVVLRLPATAQGPGLVRIEVTIGKSHVVEVKEPFDRVSVTDPNIADVFFIKPNQLRVKGKALGVTSLVVFYAQKTQFFDLVVQTDLEP